MTPVNNLSRESNVKPGYSGFPFSFFSLYTLLPMHVLSYRYRQSAMMATFQMDAGAFLTADICSLLIRHGQAILLEYPLDTPSPLFRHAFA